MARILVCYPHRYVRTLPDYDTERDMAGEHDHALKEAIRQHYDKTTHDDHAHKARLFRIEDDELALFEGKALEDAMLENRLDSFLRDERSNIKEDALRCFNLHNRPHLGCIDYKDESKVLMRTKGLPKEKWVYKCDFCPVNSYVEWQQNKKVRFRGEKR